MIKIAILGYGTVGSGVVEMLHINKETIEKRVRDTIDIKYVLDLRTFPGSLVESIITSDFEVIVADQEVDIVVEAMGGIEPAYAFVKRSLLHGKSVVTSNKALVEQHGAELIQIAREKSLNFLFEASVGGGIPIIRALTSSLTGDEIVEITGILNGTTNYMLSKMHDEGAEYEVVLKEAQEKGYAEQDPSADVDGHDACRKIAILSSMVSERKVKFEDIYTEGIRTITSTDIRYAKAMGMKIKLLAKAVWIDGRLESIVAPHLISRKHPLYHVDDVFNAVCVKGNMLGDTMFYGSGAGKFPTASAVVGDIVDAAKNLNRSVMAYWDTETLQIEEKSKSTKKFFVRIKGCEEILKEALKDTFGEVQIIKLDEKIHEFGILTEKMSEEIYEKLAKQFSEICHMIRVEC